MDTQDYLKAVEKNADSVFRVAYSYTNSKYDSDDILQNVFLKLWKIDTEFQDESHIHRWLIRVAINECKNFHKSYWKQKVDYLESVELEPQFENQMQSDLYEIVSKLSGKYRIVLHLYYFEDYNTREIADILHIKEATVRTRLVRAREYLKKKLKEEWLDEE